MVIVTLSGAKTAAAWSKVLLEEVLRRLPEIANSNLLAFGEIVSTIKVLLPSDHSA
jgi:hypothetical protein